MPRDLPRELADEIAGAEGAWSLHQIRFAPAAEKRKAPAPFFSVAVSLLHGQCWSEIDFSPSTPAEARRAVKLLRASGYIVAGVAKPTSADRVLQGTREIATELARLDLLRRDPLSLHSFPPRAQRQHKAPAQSRLRAISEPALRYLRAVPHWKWECTGAHRTGPPVFVGAKTWRANAWICAVVDEGETVIDVGMALVAPLPGPVDPKELRRLGRALRQALSPHGYRVREMKVDGRPQFLVAQKNVVSLRQARAERARFGRVVFRRRSSATQELLSASTMARNAPGRPRSGAKIQFSA